MMTQGKDGAMMITEFLLARITEDEKIGRDWAHLGDGKVTINGGGTGYMRIVNPARVLAECEAKRRIVEAANAADFWERDAAEGRGVDSSTITTDGADILRALASVYADHPDYREHWRP